MPVKKNRVHPTYIEPVDLHKELKGICFATGTSINKTVEALVRDFVDENRVKIEIK